MKLSQKQAKALADNKLGYLGGDLYSYLTPESNYTFAQVIPRNRLQLEDGTKGQIIGNRWLGDDCGIRTEFHADPTPADPDGVVEYLTSRDERHAIKIA